MTDAELLKLLWKGVADVEQQQEAADRIEQLAVTNEALKAKLAKAVELLEEIEARLKPISGFFFDTFPRREIKAILAEISSEAALNKGESHE